ncbi:hypothetical protein L345_15225, partial [Ophiophagus hannah]
MWGCAGASPLQEVQVFPESPPCRTSPGPSSRLLVQELRLQDRPRQVEVVEGCQCHARPEQCLRLPALKTFFPDSPLEQTLDVGRCAALPPSPASQRSTSTSKNPEKNPVCTCAESALATEPGLWAAGARWLTLCLSASGPINSLMAHHPLSLLLGGIKGARASPEELVLLRNPRSGEDDDDDDDDDEAPDWQKVLFLISSVVKIRAVVGLPGANLPSLPAHSDRMQLLFLLSSVAKNEVVLSAELHLFKLRAGGAEGAALQRQHYCQVSVYQVLDKDHPEAPQGKKLLSARLLALQGFGWEVFPITQAVRDWVTEESHNQGLLVTVQGLGGAPLDPHAMQFASGRAHHASKTPMLVLFTDDGRRAAALPSGFPGGSLDTPCPPLLEEAKTSPQGEQDKAY